METSQAQEAAINETVYDWILSPFTERAPVLDLVAPTWLLLAASVYFTALTIFRRPQRHYLILTVLPPLFCFASWLALQFGVAYPAVIAGAMLAAVATVYYTLQDRFFRQYPRGIEWARANVRFTHGSLATVVITATGLTAAQIVSPALIVLLPAVNIAWMIAGFVAVALLGDGLVLLWHHRNQRTAT